MTYDPFAYTATQTDIDLDNDGTSNTVDPFAYTATFNSPNFGQLETAGPTPEGLEGQFAAAFPSLYGAVGAAVEFFPWTRYLLPSNREEFVRLEPEEQTRALLWETFGTVLWVGAPYIGRGVRKGVRFLGRMLKKPLTTEAKVLPVEDALAGIERQARVFEYKPFEYEEELRKLFKKGGATPEEAEALVSAMSGDERGLINAVLERRMTGRGSTKFFEEATEWKRGVMYPQKGLRGDFKLRYGRDLVKGRFYSKEFDRLMMSEVLRTKKKDLPQNVVQAMFDGAVEKLWPGQGGKLLMKDLGEAEVANVMNLLLADKSIADAVLIAGLGRFMPLSWMPIRVAFGTGEAPWGTISRVYNPTKAMFEQVNRYHFENILKFAKMLEQRGLVEVEMHPMKGFLYKKVNFTKAEQETAYRMLREFDEQIAMALGSGEAGAVEEASKAIAALKEELPTGPVKALIETWNAYSNDLYRSYMIHQIPRVFRKGGFNRDGLQMVDLLMTKLEPKINQLFATSSQRSATEIFGGIKAILEEAGELLHLQATSRFFTNMEEKQIEKTIKWMEKQLTPGRHGFLPYLDNYTARLAERGERTVNAWIESMSEKVRKAGFVRARILRKAPERPIDFSSMVESRTYSQAKELFLHDGLSEVVAYAKELPPSWVEFIEHWLSRALNRPSIMDAKTAAVLQKSVGSIERMFGKAGRWDEFRVMRLAQNVNNLTYMGALGFKPFSVIRNLFQPLLLVPADLGGVKDLGLLVSGARRALKAETRDVLINMGAITEFAPEITMRPHALPFGKGTVFGLSQQKIDKIRDVSLWMFRGSDRWNRYVTGGAAMEKFEKALRKVGIQSTDEIFPRDFSKIEAFAKAVNLKGRNPWIQQEIKDHLWRGRTFEAYKTFVLDVIADTQYLYGGLETPLITGRSAVARTGFIFQTWWMNYLSTIEKWIRTGNPNTMTTAMLSAAIAEQLMEGIWGRKSAIRAVGLGPIPGEVSEFTIPPVWSPIYHGLATIINLQQPEISARHAKALLGNIPVFFPGGLQAMQTIRGTKEEGFPGFLKSVVRYKKDED